LATSSKEWDEDFQQRVQRHQADRGENWTTVEEPFCPSLHKEKFEGKVVLVDCLTLWLTNHMVKEGAFQMPNNTDSEATSGTDLDAPQRSLDAVKQEFDTMIKPWNVTYICVTNEVGSGTHATDEMSRKFVDAQGWFNQYVASKAERVIHVVCGVPNIIKESTAPDRRNPMPIPSKQQREEALMLDKFLSTRPKKLEEKGYWIIKLDWSRALIVAEFFSSILNEKGEVCDLQGKKISCCGEGKSARPLPMITFEGRTAKELTIKIYEQWSEMKNVLSMLDHAAYIGRETQRAEQCLYSGQFYQQD